METMHSRTHVDLWSCVVNLSLSLFFSSSSLFFYFFFLPRPYHLSTKPRIDRIWTHRNKTAIEPSYRFDLFRCQKLFHSWNTLFPFVHWNALTWKTNWIHIVSFRFWANQFLYKRTIGHQCMYISPLLFISISVCLMFNAIRIWYLQEHRNRINSI